MKGQNVSNEPIRSPPSPEKKVKRNEKKSVENDICKKKSPEKNKQRNKQTDIQKKTRKPSNSDSNQNPRVPHP